MADTFDGESMGILQIYVYKTGQAKIPVSLAANTREQDSDITYIYDKGTFYLEINSANTSWEIEILGNQ